MLKYILSQEFLELCGRAIYASNEEHASLKSSKKALCAGAGKVVSIYAT